MAALYPIGYGTRLVALSELRAAHEPNMHPAFAATLFPWIESQGGAIGIGGGFRTTQPTKPGFAPDGKSFHQAQRFASGRVAYCAVDLVHVNPGGVHRAPNWSEVPAQGSAAAARWRVHCNVSAESWHMQPINIDGYDSWLAQGRPDPVGAPPGPKPSTVAAFLDIALYQVPGASAANMTIPPGAQPPDFAVSRRVGIAAVVARTSNDIRYDPSFGLFIPAAKAAGLQTGGYGFLRPWVGTAQQHADVASRAIDEVGGITLPWMGDYEHDSKVGSLVRGRAYFDYVMSVVDIMRRRWGRPPLGYGGAGFLLDVLGDQQLVAELVAAHSGWVTPSYPHQPRAMPEGDWPLPPVDPAGWDQWARTTQGGDPGSPNGPVVPAGRGLEGWQFSSWGDRNDYGWPDPAARGLDLNFVQPDAWARWVGTPTPTPTPKPLPPQGTDNMQWNLYRWHDGSWWLIDTGWTVRRGPYPEDVCLASITSGVHKRGVMPDYFLPLIPEP